MQNSIEQRVLIESLSRGIVSDSAVYIDFTQRKKRKNNYSLFSDTDKESSLQWLKALNAQRLDRCRSWYKIDPLPTHPVVSY